MTCLQPAARGMGTAPTRRRTVALFADRETLSFSMGIEMVVGVVESIAA